MMRQLLVGILLALTMGFPAAGAAGEPSLLLGNSQNKSVIYQAIGKNEQGGVALYYPSHMMRAYKGCRITSVHIDLDGLVGTDSLRVFVAGSLDGAPLYEQFYSSKKIGWRTFELDRPVEIDGTALYIGYEVKGPQYLRYGKPLLADGEEWIKRKGEGWARYDRTYRASFYAVVEGDALPRQNIVMQHAHMPYYATTSAPVSFKGSFVNMGVDPVTELTFTLLVDGEEAGTETVGGLNVASHSLGTFEAGGFTIPQEGEHGVALRVSGVNGQADADPDDNTTRTVRLLCKEAFQPRKVLFEVFSTENCTGCPYGHNVIEGVMKDKEDVIEVGHHAGFFTDKFTVPNSEDYMWLYGTRHYAPAVVFDRTRFNDNYADYYPDSVSVIDVDATVLADIYDEARSVPAFVSVSLQPQFDEATRQLTVNVSGSQLLPVSMPDSVRLTMMLTEDSLYTSTQAGANKEYYHRHSLRRCLTPSWGDAISLADGFAARYVTDIPEEWRTDYLRVVAFVANHDGTDNTNCRVLNACEVPVSGTQTDGIRSVRMAGLACSAARLCRLSGVVSLPQGVRALRVYDVSGRLVGSLDASRPAVTVTPGLYLLR